MKYSMFIGRWQPWHDGHRWLRDQRLSQNKNVLNRRFLSILFLLS